MKPNKSVMYCKRCGEKLNKDGKRKVFNSGGVHTITYQRWKCKRHGEQNRTRIWSLSDDNGEEIKKARILVFDIETLYIVAGLWGPWNQNIQPHQIFKDWCMLSWSAKWLYSSDIMSDILKPDEIPDRDDKRICESLWKLINAADVIISYNGNAFDVKAIQTRFAKHDMPRPMIGRSIDMFRVQKDQFRHTYNRLDWVNQVFDIKCKDKTCFQDWIDCDNGDAVALKKMLDYNINDVKILEELYLKIRPWIKNHPNLALFSDTETEMCHTCMGGDLNWQPNGHDEYYITSVGKYQMYRCNKCGALGRSRTTALKKSKNKVVLTNVAR